MKKWFAILLPIFILACSKVRAPFFEGRGGPDITPATGVFPHPADWATPEKHGQFVVTEGFSLCAQCHGPNLEGGIGKGCNSCHAIWPHASGWVTLAGHGIFVAKGGGPNICASYCHGPDLAGGGSGVSCKKCHESYPHTEGWKGRPHGEFVVAKKKEYLECATMCHRQDVSPDLALPQCAKCHESYPHSIAWQDRHGDFVKLHGGPAQADCTKCHGERLTGGPNAAACTKCHHSWQELMEHTGPATTDIAKCQVCHGSDLKGDAVVAGCVKCHHKNWAQLHNGAGWSEPSQHGSRPKNGCKLCHGGDLSGGLSGVNCQVGCHSSYPHPSGWGDKNEHGRVALVNNNIEACKRCHGENLTGSTRSPACADCHKHSEGWSSKDQHGAASLLNFTRCQTCHGTNLEGALLAGSCKNAACHNPWHKGKEVTEMYCEYEGEGPCSELTMLAAYEDGRNHGSDYYASESNCRICHGNDLKGGLSNKSCFGCHDPGHRYPHADADLKKWRAVVAGRAPRLPLRGGSLGSYKNKKSYCYTACHDSNNKDKGILRPGIFWFAPDGSSRSCYVCHEGP